MKNNYNLSISVLIIFFIFVLNLSIEYSKYLELVDEEIYETKVEVLNIYNKKNYTVLKLKNNDFTFFSNFENIENISKLDNLKIAFVTTKINFFDYLKGFYTKSIYYEKLMLEPTSRETLRKKSDSQHHNEMIKELFSALFYAIPISTQLRDVCTNYGISHLIALSGFHLAVISFLIYWILYYPYSFFHTRYFPFRNKKFDLLLVVFLLLFVYLIFTGIVPSLLRAFVMMCIGVYLLRYNIKLFSFINLFFVFIIIIALFPKYMFSLSLWFSIFGVFYIFLFIQYFKNMKNRVVQVLFFNFWIYLAMNPIVHFFFPITTYEQLLSPFITLGFSIFYPLELFLHVIGYGSLLDEYLISFLNYNFYIYEVSTSLWFLILFTIYSFMSIFRKRDFYILNILLVIFNIFIIFHQYF